MNGNISLSRVKTVQITDMAYSQTNIKKLINYISSISCSKFLVALKHFVFNVATNTKIEMRTPPFEILEKKCLH